MKRASILSQLSVIGAAFGAGVIFFACDSEVNVVQLTDGGADAPAAETGVPMEGGNDAPAGSGPVSGPVDVHCKLPDGGTKVQETNQPACTTSTGDGGAEEAYPPTMNNAEGDDDQCKYHVKWSSTAVQQNTDVTITVTTTFIGNASPVTGAAPNAEIFLDETHPAPNSNVKTAETSPGVYTIGPVRFDAAGKWTVRFHFFETCLDGDESPHGHAAFFVQVP